MTYLYLIKQIGIAVAFGVWACVVAKGLDSDRRDDDTDH